MKKTNANIKIFVPDSDSAFAVAKALRKHDRAVTAERLVMIGLFYICGKVIVWEAERNAELRKQLEEKEDKVKPPKGE